jgi:malate/lactate dehydrogenase
MTAKGATYYGIGAALARMVSAILRDENADRVQLGARIHGIGRSVICRYRRLSIATALFVSCPSRLPSARGKPSRPKPKS